MQFITARVITETKQLNLIFTDFEKTFEEFDQTILQNKLLDLWLPNRTYNFIKSLLHNVKESTGLLFTVNYKLFWYIFQSESQIL